MSPELFAILIMCDFESNQYMTSDFEPPWSRKIEKIMKQCMTSDLESPWRVHQKTLARASNQAAAATAPGSSATTLTFLDALASLKTMFKIKSVSH